jgi:meso-butanediol dehydrogenase/(S,S)-butanediol dehydrogenase/diacetyl reductase
MTLASSSLAGSEPSQRRFDGKTVVVTGGSSGIGAATASLFARAGAQVLVADLNVPAERGEGGPTQPDSIIYARCDVGSEADMSAIFDVARDRFGGLDILVNNAATGAFGEVPDLTYEAWKRVIDVTLNSVFLASRAAIPLMRKRGGGAIVNVASISGLAGDFGMTSYNTAKGAVVNMTRNMAIDHAKDGIRINAVCPGLVDTPATSFLKARPAIWGPFTSTIPMGRAAQPDEIASAIVFLASPEASYMTGSILVVDGGKTAHTGQPNMGALLDQDE